MKETKMGINRKGEYIKLKKKGGDNNDALEVKIVFLTRKLMILPHENFHQ